MKKGFAFLFFLLTINTSLFCDQLTVYVSSNTGFLSGATVTVYNNGEEVDSGTTSGENGNVSFTVDSNQIYTVIASLEGYQTTAQTVNVNSCDNSSSAYTTAIIIELPISTISVSGTVTSDSSEALANASISFVPSSSAEPTILASTDSDGKYRVTSLSSGTYTINASATGYQTSSIGKTFSNGTTYTDVDFSLLSNPGTVEGTVSVEGGGVIANPYINFFQGGLAVGSTTGSASGEYEKEGLNVGQYIVSAGANGYASQSISLTVSSNTTTTQNFTLSESSGGISGVIFSSIAGFIPSATVTIFQNGIAIGHSFTDSLGVYAIKDLAPGSYLLTASASGYESSSLQVTIIENQVTTENITLTKNTSIQNVGITGTVTSVNTNTPLLGAELQLYKGITKIASTLSDETGAYSFFNIPQASYTVLAAARNYQSASISTTTINKTLVSLPVNLMEDSSPARVTGVISDSGGNISLAAISLIQDGQLIQTTYSAQDGSYSIENSPPGNYAIQATKNGYEASITSITINEGATTTQNFTLTSGGNNVTGTVTDGSTNTPLSGAFITINAKESALLLDTFSSSSGTYTIGGLPAGTFTATASYPQLLSATSSNFTFSSAQNTSQEEDFILSPIVTGLTGRVLVNKFILQNDRIHKLEWTASPDTNITRYSVSRNGEIIGFVENTFSGTLMFEDHGRSPTKTDVYVVSAETITGNTEPATPISLQ